MKITQESIYKKLDELRAKGILNTDKAINELKNFVGGGKISKESVDLLKSTIGNFHRLRIGQYITPQQIVDLMVNLVPLKENDIVIDPTCGTGSYLIAANQKIKNLKLFGIDINSNILNWAEFFTNYLKLNITYINDNSLKEIRKIPKADVIFANIPWGIIVKDIDHSLYKVKINNAEGLFLQRFIDLVKNDGWIVTVVPEGFLVSERFKQIREYTQEVSSIRAIISLPTNSFLPYSGIKTSILVLQKNTLKMPSYLAEVKDLGKEKEIIIKEFRDKIATPSVGFWEDVINNWAVSFYKRKIELENILKDLKGHKLVSLGEIAQIFTESNDNKKFDIAITQFGKILLPNEIESQKSKKIFIKIKENNVSTEFIYSFLVSKIGKEQVKGALLGSTIPYVTLSSISSIKIPLIPIEKQLELSNKVKTIKLNLDALKEVIVKAEKALGENFLSPELDNDNYLQKINKAFFSIETFPQPLTILQFRINNEEDGMRKFKEITNIFEFLARYLSIVNISDLKNNFKVELSSYVEEREFSKPTFGAWISIMLKSSKKLIELSKLGEQKPFLEDILNLDFSSINNSFSRVVMLRNQKDAHATVSEKEYQDLSSELLDLLRQITPIFNFLRNYELLRVDNLQHKDNKFINEMSSLTGISSDFEKKKFILTFPMDTNVVYLKDKNNSFLTLDNLILCEPCSECGRKEVLVYDKKNGGIISYLGFESGHHTNNEL